MADSYEGVSPDGTIRTGARRDRVPDIFEPVLRDAMELLDASGASLYVYGSVATGDARRGSSDVDLLSIDLPGAARTGEQLSATYADRCRGVEVADTAAADYLGETDAAYGNRVFLRHYCVHLAGPDPSVALPSFPADARAARGFNGDLDRHHERWRRELATGAVSSHDLAVRAARKTLLATAGLVSVHDHTWTTDRARASRRWGRDRAPSRSPARTSAVVVGRLADARARRARGGSRSRRSRRHGGRALRQHDRALGRAAVSAGVARVRVRREPILLS